MMVWGALVGSSQQVPQVPVQQTLLDYFTDANGTAIASHTPDVKPAGASWAQDVGSHTIQGNKCVPRKVTGNSIATIDGGTATPQVLVDYTASITNDSNFFYGVLDVRWLDASNLWRFNWDPVSTEQKLYIREVNAGVNTIRATGAFTWVDGTTYALRFEARADNSYHAWVDGSAIVNYTDAGGFNADKTKISLFDILAGTPTNATAWDNLEVQPL